MAETVLVTGGTGFVAGWCIAKLLQQGYAVRTTVRKPAKEASVRAAVASDEDSRDRLSFFTADLNRDDGWDAALAGCNYVLHVASPLGGTPPEDPNALIAPARDGALRVLRAATQAGVARVVMTSSTAACTPAPTREERVGNETIWTDPTLPNVTAYRQSKVLAERAAWDYMAAKAGATTFTTVLPTAVFGPLLTMEGLGSVQVILRILQGRPPGIPRLGFSIVDVRDLADLHILAMTAPEAAGERFIGAGDYMWMAEIASTLRAQLGERAAKVPTRGIPDFVFRTLARFVPPLRNLTPGLGRRQSFTSAKAQSVLGFSPRPATTTVVDCAESLLQGSSRKA
ncbi:MAG: SDR family oxidoreductase [bacterium]